MIDQLALLRDPFSLTSANFCPRTLGTALSRINRYGGLGNFPLSVAQHSTLLSYTVPSYLRLAALTHDLCEVFIGDVPASAKASVPEFNTFEDRVVRHISKVVGVPFQQYLDIRPFDVAIRVDEMRALFGIDNPSLLDMIVEPTLPEDAARQWHERFLYLNMENIDGA